MGGHQTADHETRPWTPCSCKLKSEVRVELCCGVGCLEVRIDQLQITAHCANAVTTPRPSGSPQYHGCHRSGSATMRKQVANPTIRIGEWMPQQPIDGLQVEIGWISSQPITQRPNLKPMASHNMFCLMPRSLASRALWTETAMRIHS